MNWAMDPSSIWRGRVQDPEEMHEFGTRLGHALQPGDLVILTGPLGAGKTTLTRGIGEGLGVRGPVQSPTFVLARTHPSMVGGPPLVHVDAYRLSDAIELDDLDLDFEHSVVVAEWGAGLVAARGAWLEVVIDRPTGGHTTGAGGAIVDEKTGDGADYRANENDQDWSQAPVEPRDLTVHGYGLRWAQGVFS